MKRFFLLAMLAITMCVTNSAFAQAVKIVSLEERVRKMEPSLFASADQSLVKKFLPADGAPASMSSLVLFAGEEAVLFDAGLGGETWVKKLAESGVKPENVKVILLTHMHSDHIGGLFQGNARRFPNAKVLCSQAEAKHWQSSAGAKIKAAYGNDYGTFSWDEQVFDNAVAKVKAAAAPGHTPGHTVFLVSNAAGKNECLIIGDLLHAAALQFPAPTVCTSYDANPTSAVASRKQWLDFAAQAKLPIAGMHLPAPQVGTVKKNDEGGYIWESR